MMKTKTIILLSLLTCMLTSFSQTSDFFAGKWEVTVLNSPKGDVTFLTELIRKDGKLTGELIEKSDPAGSSRKILRVEESPEKLVVYFESSQGGETIMALAKVDQDHLKGTVHDFEATAKRLK
jgi:hypothetical protein